MAERAGPSQALVGAVGPSGSQAAMGVYQVVVDQLPIAGAACATDAAAAAAGQTEETPS